MKHYKEWDGLTFEFPLFLTKMKYQVKNRDRGECDDPCIIYELIISKLLTLHLLIYSVKEDSTFTLFFCPYISISIVD